MKKFWVVIISALLASVLLIVSIAGVSAVTVYKVEGYSFTEIDDSYISICGWDNRSADLVIPESLLESRVSEIAARAFMDNEVIKTIDFNSAYYLNKIGNMAFKGCTSLEGTVCVPGSILSIGTGAFQECPLIESMYFYSSIADVPSQLCYKCSSLQSAIISDGVQSIGSYAFADCTSLTKVRIPDSVSIINNTAFNSCPDLVIYCYTNSYAQQYAEDKGIDYVLIDGPAPTEPLTEAPTEPVTPTEETTQAPTEETTQAPTEEPTQPVTEAPTQAPVAILGDVDGDGNVSTIDATFMQRYLASVAYPDYCNFAYGDVDGDGTITILDVTYIMRYLASIDVPYPINEPIQNQ